MDKNIFLPSYTIGVDAYKSIPEVCKPYGRRIVLIGGKTALSKAKAFILEESTDFEVLETYWYGGEASMENVERLMAESAVKEADMFFAIGGGKAIDTVKMLSNELNKPIFTFPTIASTCASITSVCAQYEQSGVFKCAYMRKRSANHTFIHSEILAEAPYKFLWAGIGDTLAKGYEPAFSAYGKELDYLNRIGITLSKQCIDPLVKFGNEGMEACQSGLVNEALEECILAIIVTTGLVSNFVIFDYNTAVAHALCYGFTILEEVEKNHLHGELVSYGVLVQLMLDEDYQSLDRLLPFYRMIKLPTKLADFNLNLDMMQPVLEKAVSTADVEVVKIAVDETLLYTTIEKLETYILR